MVLFSQNEICALVKGIQRNFSFFESLPLNNFNYERIVSDASGQYSYALVSQTSMGSYGTSTNIGVIRSTDYGARWEQTNFNLTWPGIPAADDYFLFAAKDHNKCSVIAGLVYEIFLTFDCGVTWVSPADEYFLQMDIAGADTGQDLILTTSGLYDLAFLTSSDIGLTWTERKITFDDEVLLPEIQLFSTASDSNLSRAVLVGCQQYFSSSTAYVFTNSNVSSFRVSSNWTVSQLSAGEDICTGDTLSVSQPQRTKSFLWLSVLLFTDRLTLGALGKMLREI